MEYETYERALSPRPRSQLSSEYSGASTAHPVEWQDEWIHREEEFRDTINALQNEQERIQKKTFTNWINSHVEHHHDKYVVRDLFTDLKDGRILLALIESLTGDHLPCETFRHYTRAHYLSNVERALDYLRERGIKLVNINSSDIVDGNETVILGLIWTIILNFQIDQDLAHLRENFLISPVPSGAQSASYDARSRSVSPSPTKKQRVTAGRGRFQAGASKVMLKWCQKEISDRFGVPILNLSASWKDGMAFLGLVKVLDPNLVNLNDFRSASPTQRMNAAFSLAQERLGIAKLLDVADIDVDRPDERSIMTYIAQFIKRFPEAKRNRQKMAMENLPDVEAIEASERAEYERIRDWCLDVLTILKCLELTDERPFEAYEEYKRFQQNFRTNITAFARLKEQYEEGRTLHLTEANVTELDSLFSRVISEKLIWHRHLFEVLQGQERNLCHRYERIESELDQRVLLPPQKVTHYSKGNLEFRVQKHEDAFAALNQLREDVDEYLSRDLPTDVFAWHDLAGDIHTMTLQLEHRLLSERCKLIIKRQLTIVDEWERRIIRWQEFLKPPGNNLDRLANEFELHVVQERIFDQFLELSKQLQACLERLQDDVAADRQQRAGFLSTAVNSNRRWKRIGEELHVIREEVRRLQVLQKKKVGRLDLEAFSRDALAPSVSITGTTPTSPPPLYLKSEHWSLYLQLVAAFNRWLDRTERDFESIDREDVGRVEYHQGLQRFRALCNEVVEHKSDGQQIIDTFYTCSSDLPPQVVAEETRKINRLIRRYDALIPSLEVVRSEVEHSAIHSHQIVDTHKETVQIVPDRPESGQDPHVRVRTPGGALSPTVSVGTSGYATPEFENALLRRSEPTTPSESFNRSPPFAYGVSSQSSMNEGSPIEPVFVRDIDIVEQQQQRRPVSSPSPRDVAAEDRLLVRGVPTRHGGEVASTSSSSHRPRVAFRDDGDDMSGGSDGEENSTATATAVKRMKASVANAGRSNTERFTESMSEASSSGLRTGIVPVNFDRSKIQSLRAAFETPKSSEDAPPPTKFTTTKKFGIFDTLRRKSRSSSSGSGSSSDGEGKSGERAERKKKAKKEEPVHGETATFVRDTESVGTARQRPAGVAFAPTVSDRDVEEALHQPSSSLSPGEAKRRYIRNVKTTTLVTSTETKTVKTITMEKNPNKEKLVEGTGKPVGKLTKPAVFTGETSVRNVEESRTTVGKLKRPEIFTGSPVPSTSGSSATTSGVPIGRVKAQLAELRKRQGSTDDSDTSETRSPGMKKPDVLPLRRSSDEAEKSSPFGGLKKTKKNITTEYEETTQTVKRTVLSPVHPDRTLLEQEATRTVVRDAVDVTPRRLDFDEGIQPQSIRSPEGTTSGYQQSVVIAPYGTPRAPVDPSEASRKANRMIDLFEKGKDDPTLFVEQIPEARPSYEYVTSYHPESPHSHVTSTPPIQLYVEREETYTYGSPVPLTQPVSQRIQSFEEIFAPLNTDIAKFDSGTTERRSSNPNFNSFVVEQFVREAQAPPPTPEVETETMVRSTEEDKGKRKSGGLFGGIFKSKKVTPTTTTVTTTETSYVTQPEPVVRDIEVVSREKSPKIHHHVGGSDRYVEETTGGHFSLPSDVRSFLGDTEEPSAPLGSSEHFREIIRRLSQGDDVVEVVTSQPTPVSQVHIPDVYLRETTSTVVRPDRPDTETAIRTRPKKEITHFVPLSDREFESRVVGRHPVREVEQETMVTDYVETTPVHGRIRHFENIQDVSQSRSSTEELSSPTRVTREKHDKKSAFAQWAEREEQAATVTRSEEKPKRSVLETLGIRNKVTPISITTVERVEEMPPAFPVSRPPALPTESQTVSYSTPVVEVRQSDLTHVREAPEEPISVEEMNLVEPHDPVNFRCVYPLADEPMVESPEPVIVRQPTWPNQVVYEETVVERIVRPTGEGVSTPVISLIPRERRPHGEISHREHFGDQDIESLLPRDKTSYRDRPTRPLSGARDDFITYPQPFDGSPVMNESVRTERIDEFSPTDTYVRERLPSYGNIAQDLAMVSQGIASAAEQLSPPRRESPKPTRPRNEESLFESVTIRKDSPEDIEQGDASILVRDVTERVSVPKPEDRRSREFPIDYSEEPYSPEFSDESTKRQRGPDVEHRVGGTDSTVLYAKTRTRSVSPPSKYQKTKFESVHSESLPSTSFDTKSEEVYREDAPPRDERVPDSEILEETVVRSSTPDIEKSLTTKVKDYVEERERGVTTVTAVPSLADPNEEVVRIGDYFVTRPRSRTGSFAEKTTTTTVPVASGAHGMAALKDRLKSVRSPGEPELETFESETFRREPISTTETYVETVETTPRPVAQNSEFFAALDAAAQGGYYEAIRERGDSVPHHVGSSDQLIEQYVTSERSVEVAKPVPVVREKVSLIGRDSSTPIRPTRTEEISSEHVVRSRSKSPADNLADTHKSRTHVVRDLTETVTRVRSPSRREDSPKTIKIREHSVEKTRYPDPDSAYLEETVTRVRSGSPDVKKPRHRPSGSREEFSESVIRAVSPERQPVFSGGGVSYVREARPESPAPEYEPIDTTPFARPVQPYHFVGSSDRDIADFLSRFITRERIEQPVEDVFVVETKTATPETLTITHSGLPVVPIPVPHLTAEETEAFEIRNRPAKVRHISSVDSDFVTSDFIAVHRQDSPREEFVEVVAPTRHVVPETVMRDLAPIESLTERVVVMDVADDVSGDDFIRTRPPRVDHRVGVRDRDLEVLIPSRPVLVTSISETDLAPKRRVSGPRLDKTESSESTDSQQYPWQSGTPVSTPTIVREEETAVQQTTSPAVAPRPSTSFVRETVVEETEPSQPSTSVRKASSSSSDSKSTSSVKKEKKEKKKSGFFGGLFGSKDKKKEKEAKQETQTVVTSTSVRTEKASPTRPIIAEDVEGAPRYEQKGVSGVGFKRVSDEEFVSTSAVVTPAREIREIAGRDTVGELIHGPKPETQVRTAESVITMESVEPETVTLVSRSRPTVKIYHHPGSRDADVERLAVKHRPLPAAVTTTETVVRPLSSQEQPKTYVTTEELPAEIEMVPSRATTKTPSFIAFEQATTSSSAQHVKRPKERLKKISSGSRKSTPSPAPSGGSVEEELRRSRSPASFGGEEYSETVRSRSAQSRERVLKHKEQHVETKRVPSGDRGDRTRSEETLEENVIYTRPASSLERKEKFEEVTVVRSGEEGDRQFQRAESPVLEAVQTPEPTRELEFTTYRERPASPVFHRDRFSDQDVEIRSNEAVPAPRVESLAETTVTTTVEQPTILREVSAVEEIARVRPERVTHHVGLSDSDLATVYTAREVVPASPTVESLRETVTTVTTAPEPAPVTAVTRDVGFIEESSKTRPERVVRTETVTTVTTVREPSAVPIITREAVAVSEVPRVRPGKVRHREGLSDSDWGSSSTTTQAVPVTQPVESLRETVTTVTTVPEPVVRPISTREISVTEEIPRVRPEGVTHRVGLQDSDFEGSYVRSPVQPSAERLTETVVVEESPFVKHEYVPLRDSTTTVREAVQETRQTEVISEPRERRPGVRHPVYSGDIDVESRLPTRVREEEDFRETVRTVDVPETTVHPAKISPSSSSSFESATTTTVLTMEEPVKTKPKKEKASIFGFLKGSKKTSSSTVVTKEVEEPTIVRETAVTREHVEPEVEFSRTSTARPLPGQTVVRDVPVQEVFVERVREEEPVNFVPRDRFPAVHHSVGLSDSAILTMLPAAVVRRDSEPEFVISQETVTTTTTAEKPVVKPRLTKKTSIPQPVEDVTMREQVLVVEEAREPRTRVGGVYHRANVSDADIESYERRRVVEVVPEPKVERESETVEVTESQRSPVGVAEFKEVNVEFPKDEPEPTIIRESETVVVREEAGPSSVSVVDTSVKPERKKSKSGGIFGMFKRKSSKDSSEVVSETHVQQTVTEVPVAAPKKEKVVPTTTMVREVTQERSDVQQKPVVVEEIEPRIRTGGVYHRGHLSDADIEPFERRITVESVPEPTTERFSETVVVSETPDTPIRTTEIKAIPVAPRDVTYVRSDEFVSQEPVEYRSPVVVVPEEPIGVPDWTLLQERVEVQPELDLAPRNRPPPISHFVGVRDLDIENIAIRHRVIAEPEVVIRESETVTTVPIRETETHVEEAKIKQPVKKTVSFDRPAEVTVSRETVRETETVENIATSSTTKVKTEKSKSKGLFGFFKSGSKTAADERQTSTVVTEVAPEPTPVTVVEREEIITAVPEEEIVAPRRRYGPIEHRSGFTEEFITREISEKFRDIPPVHLVPEEELELSHVRVFSPSEEFIVETVFRPLSPEGERRVQHGVERIHERLTEIRSHRETEHEVVIREREFVREELAPALEPVMSSIVEIPRERFAGVTHRDHVADRDVDPNLTRVREAFTASSAADRAEKPLKRDDEYEYEHVTVTTINTAVEPEEEPTVVFGVSEAPRVTKAIMEVEQGPSLVAARQIPAEPLEEYVTTREVTSTAVKEKKPKGASILKNRTSATVLVSSPPPTDVQIVQAEEEFLHPRERPARVYHRTGLSDLLVSDQIVRLQPDEEDYEERVTLTTPTKKAARVVVASSSSSSSESESERESHYARVQKPPRVTVSDVPVVDYSEVVIHTRDRSPPPPVQREVSVYDETSLIRVVPQQAELPSRVRPEPIFHHVGISDFDNERFMDASSSAEPLKPHKSLERLITTTSRPVVMTTYNLDEPTASDEERALEALDESVTVVRDRTAPVETYSQKTKAAVKTKLTGSPLEAGRYRAPEAATQEILDESVRFDTGPEAVVAVSSVAKGPKVQRVSDTTTTVVREAGDVMYAEVTKPKKVRQSRRSSASSDSSLSDEGTTTKKRKAPKVPVKAAETIITREEYEKKTPVAQTMSETLVRDVYPETATTSQVRAISPSSATTSETVTTLSVSQAGSRSKTPDSATLKHSKMKTVKQKIRGGTPGPSTSKDGEYSYEDVIYWKTPKTKSPEPDHSRSATIDVTRTAKTVSPPARSSSMAYGAKPPEYTETAIRVHEKPITETFVREGGTATVTEKAPGVSRQKVVETVDKSRKGKSVVKKTRSNRSDSSSSSSKEDVDEISSVTLTKAKLTSPTPEPRDEVQMVLAEMKAKDETVTTVRETRELSGGAIHHVKAPTAVTSTVVRRASSLSSTDTEDEQGRKVRRKRRRVKTQPRVTETTQERIVTRPVAAQRDSETGIALIERTTTNQLPSYISFGTVEPDQLPTTEMETLDIRGLEPRHRPSVKLYHSAGPKDDRIESTEEVVQVTSAHVQPLKPIRSDRAGSSDQFHEQVTVLSTPEARIHVSHRTPSSTSVVEEALETSSTRQTGTAVVQVAESRSAKQITPTVVRNVETESEARVREKLRETEVRTASPVERAVTTTLHVEEGPTLGLAPSRARSAMNEEASTSRVVSRPGSASGFEHLEETVDVYRVKFAKELENQRARSPNVYIGHEDLTMRTVSSQDGRVSAAASSPTSPGPLALPYPDVLRVERNLEPESEFAIVRTHSERLGISKPKETLTKETTVLKMQERPTTPSEQTKRRVITTHDSVETSLVVEDFRRAALSSPDVGDMEYWTTSGGSSDNLDIDKQSELLNRHSQVSETPTYESIPPREKPARAGKAPKKTSVTQQETSVTVVSHPEPRVEIYSDIEETRRAIRQEGAQTGQPSSTSRIAVVTSPEVEIIESRGYNPQNTPPTYAKIQKRKKEVLVEDVFYWKVLNRRKNKAYSAERIRASSPENNLTSDEMATLAQSITEINTATDRKSRKSETVTKTNKRRTKSVTGVQSPGYDDSGSYSASEAARENYNVDLRLTSTLDSGSASNTSSLGRRNKIAKSSPLPAEKRTTLPTMSSIESPTAIQTRSFSPSSNERLSGGESPYEGGSSSNDYVDDRSRASTPQGERTSKLRSRLIADVEYETTVRSASDEADRVYRVAMREPLPDRHSCLPAYNTLYGVVREQLEELDGLVLDPDCQYIDQEILREERQRFTALLDGLVRINRDLDRLDDLYRAMINVEPDGSIWETESRQRELNQLYMDLLGHLKCILRRIKHLENLLDEYRRKRLHFRVHLLEELTYFRTHENMSEDDQRERVSRLLEEVLQLRAATYGMFVRSTRQFAQQLEDELHDILTLLRTELRGSIIQLLLTGKYSVEFDATQQRLILSSDDIMDEVATSTARMNNPTVWSVLRRALPMQALALILLGFASLIPMTDDEFSCVFSNYFASSFNPALKFSGPPPL